MMKNEANRDVGRKIRDRIAKLQERVIANELRATAAFHGWDHSYTPTHLQSSKADVWQSSPYEHTISPRDLSAMSTVPSTSYLTPYMLSAPQTGSTTSTSPQSILPVNSSGFLDTWGLHSVPLSSPLFSIAPSSGPPLPVVSSPDMEPLRDAWAGSDVALPSESMADSPTSQPTYYVATEAALPHIIQALQSNAVSSKIVVIAPTDSISPWANGANNLISLTHTGDDGASGTPRNGLSMPCQCQTVVENSPGAQFSSQDWVLPSSDGLFPQRKISGPFDTNYATM
ncbi:hypothetical protein N7468_007909 [Penicillium chermesinum]|uniref:BZIP domain-containing protein n=1 Tax=Penicillium chermesinum TaxID=63820 RepID=A0A9W9THS9_9EURO|nr:uncharacterized protein N7468_007909 [Penicillium chermesinum]KAJ5223367.1 hypothetical protein N7468_007909 [Penicillium chermesinum]